MKAAPRGKLWFSEAAARYFVCIFPPECRLSGGAFPSLRTERAVSWSTWHRCHVRAAFAEQIKAVVEARLALGDTVRGRVRQWLEACRSKYSYKSGTLAPKVKSLAIKVPVA